MAERIQYHRDPDKRAQFEALQGDTLPVEDLIEHVVGIMLDRVRAVLDIGNAIFDLRRNMAICPFPERIKARRPGRRHPDA